MSDINKKVATLEQIVELAQEVEKKDPIDWSQVSVTPETAYGMMAAHIIDLFEKEQEADREITMMSVMTKLLVENFVLNLKLENVERTEIK